jgi:hypothetical protein
MAATTGSQQEATAAAVATVAATAATAVPPEPVPTAVAQATVVEIPNDDAPPPGWGQWENWPAPAPEPTAGLLVVREDDCVVPRQPSHGAEASSSRAVQPIPGVTITRPGWCIPHPFWFYLAFLGYAFSRMFRSTLQGY